jgi:hypothetical protein
MGGQWTYQLRHIKCGKPKCRCADGAGHGPYWYGFRHRNGEMESKYFGKRGPRLTSQPHYLRARHSKEPKDYTSALRTFGFRQPPTAIQIRDHYKHLASRHGGNPKRMQRIDAAYEVLRRRHGGAGS